MERALVAYRIGDLVGTYNLGTMKYSFVLWSQLWKHMLKMDGWRLLEQLCLNIPSCAVSQIISKPYVDQFLMNKPVSENFSTIFFP
jgi:hypothetical protein